MSRDINGADCIRQIRAMRMVRAQQLRDWRGSGFPNELIRRMVGYSRDWRRLNADWLEREAKRQYGIADENSRNASEAMRGMYCGQDDAWYERNVEGPREYARECWAMMCILIWQKPIV